MNTVEINPTFGISQQVEVPVTQQETQAPPAPVQLEQVLNPNEPNIINGNESGFAQQTENPVQTGDTFNTATPETIGGTNPLIWNSPIYTATGIGDHESLSDNPNARLVSQAAEIKKNPKQKTDKTKEINQGGVKAHTITPKEIKDLEKQTNLTLYPYLFGGELARIKHQFTNLNQNKYYLLSCVVY